MPPAPTAQTPDVEWQWSQLLDYVEEGLVVPVIGGELLWTDIAGERRHALGHLARQLAARGSVPWPDDQGSPSISEVVQAYLSLHGRGRNWPYTALSQLVRELDQTPPPRTLLKLAELPFRLFVSTTPDSYLERALNTVRFGGRADTHVVQYGLGSNADLPEGGDTIVFPLLGRANPSPDYAITDEDVLEFVHRFQVTGTPRRLLDTLRRSHVLMLGGGFSDWLARFFIRLARPDRLWTSTTTQLTHFVAGRSVSDDLRLRSFLEHPLTDTQVFPVTDAEQFADELHQRWKVRHPGQQAVAPVVQPRTADPDRKLGGVFLSYASEDYDAAERVRTALHDAGIDVWFDKRDLNAGDEFERKIAEQISKSYLFVMVISNHVLTPEPRFFRFEWREAETRAKFAAFDVPYVLPVAIDDTPEDAPRLPAFVRKVHWTRAPAGTVPSEFVTTLVKAYREAQRPVSQT